MSGVQLKVLPQFPAQVSGIAPIVVTKVGLTYTISYNPLTATLAVSQIKQQLVANGQFDTILATIPGSPSSTVNMIWTGGGFTQTNGPLLASIFATLGYNAAQQAAFLAAAALFPY
jgi:hypothetical protein